MSRDNDVYQKDSVKYMVNHKGHKISPYHTENVSKPKRIDWNTIIAGITLIIVFGGAAVLMIVTIIANL